MLGSSPGIFFCRIVRISNCRKYLNEPFQADVGFADRGHLCPPDDSSAVHFSNVGIGPLPVLPNRLDGSRLVVRGST